MEEKTVEMLCALNKDENLDLFHRITHNVTVKYEEMDALCKANGIKMSKSNLKDVLDDQGITYSLPEPPNAVRGPRRAKRKRRK